MELDVSDPVVLKKENNPQKKQAATNRNTNLGPNAMERQAGNLIMRGCKYVEGAKNFEKRQVIYTLPTSGVKH